MASKSRLIGDNHVKSVYQALLDYINDKPLVNFPFTTLKTVEYINLLFPNIKSINTKFEKKQPDQECDLTLTTKDGIEYKVNLFFIKKGKKIQPKNLGAKSFLEKYFLAADLQSKFNRFIENEYKKFLDEIVSLRLGEHYVNEVKELKKLVANYFPDFIDEINPIRDKFLYRLREFCFSLFKDSYNNKSEGYLYAYNSLFMTDHINIITYYGKNESDVGVEEFSLGTSNYNDIQIYKIAKNTVGIKYGRIGLTLRFKFESGPTSSIKLATSYEVINNDELDHSLENNRTIEKVNRLLKNHSYMEASNSSNAIGKCHEAFTYYYFLKEFPSVSQVEKDECVSLLEKYYSIVKKATIEKLFESTSTIVFKIKDKLSEKYGTYNIEGIELIPDNYIIDRLDTGDLQLILKVEETYIIENISLKALARRSSKVTTKNPGIGTILGPTYFNVGSMTPVIKEVREKFESEEINHTESLRIISKELGLHLSKASQEQLKQGIENLLGKAVMAITIYNENVSYCIEHSKINSTIKVYLNRPSPIQNTLAWNNDLEEISLRVKFSKGQRHGWSTIKLTSEYQFK